MTTVSVRVEGLRELGERMRRLSDDVNKKVARAATNAGAQVIKKLAIVKAPAGPASQTPKVPPNYLKNNIIVRYNRKTRLTSQHLVTVRHKGKGVLPTEISASPYSIGVFQEFGTVHHAPQAFLRPAYDSGKMRAVEAIKKRLKQRIDQAERTGK